MKCTVYAFFNYETEIGVNQSIWRMQQTDGRQGLKRSDRLTTELVSVAALHLAASFSLSAVCDMHHFVHYCGIGFRSRYTVTVLG